MANMYMEIVTPETMLWQGDVRIVTGPGFLGEFGVLPEHAPLITSLEVGPMHFVTAEGEEQWAAVHGGYFEILDNRITILAQHAELAEKIDVERLERSKGRAEARLQEFSNMSQEDKDVIRAQASLKRALVRQSVSTRRK